jgi:hypothetical protein
LELIWTPAVDPWRDSRHSLIGSGTSSANDLGLPSYTGKSRYSG